MPSWPYTLRAGHSAHPSDGACAMDAVNWLVHGEHGAAPVCACPVIGAFVIAGNDAMPDDVRQRLVPYLHRIAGSRSSDHEEARARVLWLATVRHFAPLALDFAEMSEAAASLRGLHDDVLPLDAVSQMQAIGQRAHVAANKAGEAAAKAYRLIRLARLVDAVSMTEKLEVQKEHAWLLFSAAHTASMALDRACRSAIAASNFAVIEAARFAGQAAGKGACVFTPVPVQQASIWDAYFVALDRALSAGPQGEPWSADVLQTADGLYRAAGGLASGRCGGALVADA